MTPIYKRGSVYLASNYRGVHLVAILAKVAERVIAKPLTKCLQTHAFGLNQWAFTKKRNARDLATFYIAQWIRAICRGMKIGVYMSDISGAFDRVFKEFLMAKLYRAGLPDTYLNFLSSYLEPRVGRVTVAGALSEIFELSNTVFQGTVLGPTLWNVFFADVSFAATRHSGQEAMFADDLNISHFFPRSMGHTTIRETMEETQKDVHEWGRRNRVVFDASKEHFLIVHTRDGEGEDFKLLGCLIDCKLTVKPTIDYILAKVRPKAKAILRTRGQYNVEQMLHQFKTHIWGFVEYANACYAHACDTQLNRLDSFQRGFLHELDVTEEAALIHYNFAPFGLRRDVGLLGLIHKRVLGIAHPAFNDLFPWAPDWWYANVQFLPRHDKQIDNQSGQCVFNHGLFNKSIFGTVHIYNRLPQKIVDCESVTTFQRELMVIVKRRCQYHHAYWKDTFKADSPNAWV